ncbi:hypothetical protein NECAME_09575, partial [Necator americanus]
MPLRHVTFTVPAVSSTFAPFQFHGDRVKDVVQTRMIFLFMKNSGKIAGNTAGGGPRSEWCNVARWDPAGLPVQRLYTTLAKIHEN